MAEIEKIVTTILKGIEAETVIATIAAIVKEGQDPGTITTVIHAVNTVLHENVKLSTILLVLEINMFKNHSQGSC